MAIEIKKLKLSQIKLNPDNPRQINKKQLERLVKSLREFPEMLELREIVIDENMMILGGNQRYRALKQAGEKECIAKIVTGLSDEQKREFIIKDNGTNWGEWDFDALANGWDDLPLVEWGVDLPEDWLGIGESTEPSDAEPQIDKAEELNKVWKVNPGDLWQIAEHRLLCGDSTKKEDVERVMGGKKADMIFIDPPYMTFGSSTGKLEPNDFNMLAPFWSIVTLTAQRNLNDGASFFCCCDWRSYPLLFTQAFQHLKVNSLIVWDLGGALKLNMDGFRPSYELILYAVNSKFGRNWKNKQAGAWKIKNRRERDLWTINQKEAAPSKRREHPSQKPVELIKRAINNGCINDGVVFDYFLGSGTTMVACQNLNRKCYGIEISPDYCAVVLQRMQDAFPDIEIRRL
jgi:DNA modification methylase